jgi:hypothetical protein
LAGSTNRTEQVGGEMNLPVVGLVKGSVDGRTIGSLVVVVRIFRGKVGSTHDPVHMGRDYSWIDDGASKESEGEGWKSVLSISEESYSC